MAKCHQNVLNILSIIYKKTGRDFLIMNFRFLSQAQPESILR